MNLGGWRWNVQSFFWKGDEDDEEFLEGESSRWVSSMYFFVKANQGRDWGRVKEE